jgi:hypothetical protein
LTRGASMPLANSLPTTITGLTVQALAYSLENKELLKYEEKEDAPSGTTDGRALDLAQYLKDGLVLVELESRDAGNKLISNNFYWVGGQSADYRKLNRLPVAITVITRSKTERDYSDNYVSLLPGESKEIEIVAPKLGEKAGLALGLRGWNVAEKVVNVVVAQ